MPRQFPVDRKLLCLLSCDVTLLYRTLVREGVPLARMRPQITDSERALRSTIRRLLSRGLEARMTDAQPHFESPRYIQYRMAAPVLHQVSWGAHSRYYSQIRDALGSFDYGWRSGCNSYGVVARLSYDGNVYLTLQLHAINQRFYENGYRLVEAWRRMLDLPARVRALEDEWRRRGVA